MVRLLGACHADHHNKERCYRKSVVDSLNPIVRGSYCLSIDERTSRAKCTFDSGRNPARRCRAVGAAIANERQPFHGCALQYSLDGLHPLQVPASGQAAWWQQIQATHGDGMSLCPLTDAPSDRGRFKVLSRPTINQVRQGNRTNRMIAIDLIPDSSPNSSWPLSYSHTAELTSRICRWGNDAYTLLHWLLSFRRVSTAYRALDFSSINGRKGRLASIPR